MGYAFQDALARLLVATILVQTMANGGLYTFSSLLINKAFGFAAATAQILGLPLAIFTILLYFRLARPFTASLHTSSST